MPPSRLLACHHRLALAQSRPLFQRGSPARITAGYRTSSLPALSQNGRDARRTWSLSRGETARNGKLGVRTFQSGPGELAKPFTPEAKEKASNFGMLFDCDGVLYAGNRKIPGATTALGTVRHHHVRYLFLTNGGGTSVEAVKADDLQRRIETPLEDDVFAGRVVQSHTPFSGWSDHVKENETIFITSSHPEKARAVAKAYGFKNVVTSADLLAHDPALYPFEPPKDARTEPLPNGATIFKSDDPTAYDAESLERSNTLKIDHIFIWNDPRDWSLDTQILHDILVSHRGYLGTVSRRNGDGSTPNDGWQADGQPALWMSNLDLVWRTQYHINRFGTGAFLEAFKGTWAAVTGGRELSYRFMGKPSTLTYDYAHDRLLGEYARLQVGKDRHPLRTVYMVGDNPESDIRGAAEYFPEDGTEYVPILVRTGVWQETERGTSPKWEPAVVVDDVLDAVVWALQREGIDADRETLLKHEASSFAQR